MPAAPIDIARIAAIYGRPEEQRCLIPPHPDLAARIRSEAQRLNGLKRVGELATTAELVTPRHPGFNDGLIIPGSAFPLGTSLERVRSAAASRAPLHGQVRVVVVLVDFPDQAMSQTREHIEELFFSTGVLPDGSVKEYFTDVTNGLVELTGQVVGPYRMPRTLATYAGGESGTGSAQPNARTMAQDAAAAADADVNYGPYDNDGDGFVDAFIVVHAGGGAEQTGNGGDIWSHKWVLPSAYSSDTTQIYAYLTVPEDARIGVCAHEIGHLVFGFPDLYDTDNTSEGVGDWCLMAGGSWGGGGDRPVHPSAWCKAQQEWVTVHNVTTNSSLSIADVKDDPTVYRLWKDGGSGQEYFLLENRQADRRDTELPGGGLLIWHIDDAMTSNADEMHYKVALEQADGARGLENNVNRGDGGDPYPGSSDNRAFGKTTTPSSQSYGSVDTCVSVTAISDPGPVMTANVTVRCGKSVAKDVSDTKLQLKDLKDGRKERKEVKEHKELAKEKDLLKDGFKERKEIFEKPVTDKHTVLDKGTDGKLGEDKLRDGKLGDGKLGDKLGEGKLRDAPQGYAAAPDGVEARLAAIEEMLAALLSGEGVAAGGYGAAGAGEQLAGGPFIGHDLRPDLADSALHAEEEGGPSGPVSKRLFDTPSQFQG